MKKILQLRSFPIIAGIMVGLSVAPMLSLITTKMQTSYDLRPVVADMRIVNSYIDGKNRYIKVIGNKVRNDCSPPISITGYDSSNLAALKSIVFLSDVDENSGDIKLPHKREAGINDFGWWELNPIPRGNVVVFKVINDCNGQLVLSEFALDITNKEDQMTINKVDTR